jgi:hypothetical protein
MDEFDISGDGSQSGTADLIASLASNASQAYQTSVIANANPLNAALITGGTATTAQGTTASLAPSAIGASGIWLLLIAAIVIFFAVKQ